LTALERVADALRAEGGLLAAALDDGAGGTADGADGEADGAGGAGPGPAAIAAAGPRAAACPDEYELLVEAIYEGYRQHYAAPRLLAAAEPDLRLLAGDRLYAIGLERLVALGDVALCALAHARGDGDLAGLLWAAGARAVGWGASPAYVGAKRLLLAGDERGPGALRAAAAVAVPPSEEPGR
jgi:hypothetical protein